MQQQKNQKLKALAEILSKLKEDDAMNILYDMLNSRDRIFWKKAQRLIL